VKFTRLTILLLTLTTLAATSHAQDSLIHTITEVPVKFLKQTNDKIDKYTSRISSKTEKTLTKLSKWENKIRALLDRASPQTAQQLFGNGKLTFASMLQKIKEGKSLAENAKARYTEYNDKLITNIKFIETKKGELDNKYIKPLQNAKAKIQELEKDVTETETAEKLIKERKKELLTEAYKVLGKSKYFNKINKESFYYVETLKNYKEIFSEPGKAEKVAFEILNKIPAVKEFVQNNSMLASLFGSPNAGGGADLASLAGLQTRASVNSLIQGRIAAGGPNAAALVSANMQQAQAELGKLKDKIMKAGGGGSNNSSSGEEEDGFASFRKKDVKSKTFKQRLEFGSDFQFGRPNRIVASQANISVSAGYKLNDKSIIGVALAYKINYGSIDNFYLQHGGIGIRSFMDWKLKKQFFVSFGYELNYNQNFKNFSQVVTGYKQQGLGGPLQSSGLIGISKKIKFPTSNIGKKAGLVKGTKISLLYDFLYNSHVVASPSVVFRVGYNF
jgi:hypothetical protein